MAKKKSKKDIIALHNKLKSIHKEIKKVAHQTVLTAVQISAHAHGKVKPDTVKRAKRMMASIHR